MADLRDASITVSISETGKFTLLPKRTKQDKFFQGNWYSTKKFNPVIRSYHQRRLSSALITLLRETTTQKILQRNIPATAFLEKLIKDFKLEDEAAAIVSQLIFDINLLIEQEAAKELVYKVGLKFLCDLLIYLDTDPLLAFTKLYGVWRP